VEITAELFEQQRSRRFGETNPEKMQFAFWEWMVREKLEPYRVRELFKAPFQCQDDPIWTFSRMGATRSQLPDGRSVSIGGEYEDYYDPDFCIYNDVVVERPSGEVEIYGFPEDDFPPTDFHTATLVRNCMVIVGGLGYQRSRHPGRTPVYSLDFSNYHISQVRTTGENPGWIFKHQAELETNGVVRIWGGMLIQGTTEEQRYRRSFDDYALDTNSWTWICSTRRNWRQIVIRQKNRGMFAIDRRPKPEALLPKGIPHTRAACEEWNGVRILVQEVPVCLTIGVSSIDVIIEGGLSDATIATLAEEIRSNAEAATGQVCTFD
jgi:hypothetical protein